MTANDTKLNYLYTWDIDQLIATGTVAIGTSATAVYSIPANIPAIPTYEVQLQVGGRWYQAGQFSTTNTLAGYQSFYTYVQAGQVFIKSTVAGNARYFVWVDKVNY